MRRLSSRFVPAGAAALALGLAALAVGCGNKFSLPTETPGGVIPEKGSYAYTGSVRNLPNLTDVLLTRGSGSTLYVVFDTTTVRAFPRIFRVDGNTPPLSYSFQGLFRPIRICQGPGVVWVLDAGDTTLGLADTTKAPGILEYGPTGGAPLFVYRDTTLASVAGIAADGDGNVYVSGVAKEFVRDDPTDTRKTTYKYASRIRRYLRAQGWEKDTNFYVDEGQGVGTVFQPGDLFVDPQQPVSRIYVADTGKDQVQRLEYVPNNHGNPLPSLSFDGNQTGVPLLQPADVCSDLPGFIYIADTGRHRVLRYDDAGTYIQRVDIELDLDADSLHAPVAVSCDDSLVYVADQVTGKVASYKRRK
jgi:hypothetical protein